MLPGHKYRNLDEELTMNNQTIVLTSKYEPKKCSEIVSASIDAERSVFVTTPGDKSFLGAVEDLNFRIHKRINYRNGFQTNLFGTIKQSNGGSLITCRFGISTPARVVLSVVTLVTLFFEARNTYSLFPRPLGNSSLTQNEWIGITVPLVMFGVIWAVYFLGKLISAKEKKALIRFLEEKLETTV